MPTPGARLRAAWSAEPIMIPGAFNALVAKLAERLGFKAVYLSGWRTLGGVGGAARYRSFDPDRVCRASGRTGSGDQAAGLVRRRHRIWRGRQRRAHGAAFRGDRCRGLASGGPGASQAMWAAIGQVAHRSGSDGNQGAGRREGAARSRLRDRRTDRRARRRGLRRCRAPGPGVPCGRRRHDLPRGPRVGRRIRALRRGRAMLRCSPT